MLIMSADLSRNSWMVLTQPEKFNSRVVVCSMIPLYTMFCLFSQLPVNTVKKLLHLLAKSARDVVIKKRSMADLRCVKGAEICVLSTEGRSTGAV